MKHGERIDAARNIIADAIDRDHLVWSISWNVHDIQWRAVSVYQDAVWLAFPRGLQHRFAFDGLLPRDELFAGVFGRASTSGEQ